MIVKVCGVRSAEIVEVAADAGADWIGLVFAPSSPRYVDDVTAGAVSAAARGRLGVVGVFVSPSADRCNDAVARYHLDAVQLHGEVHRDIVRELDVPAVRAIHPGSAADAYRDDWWPDCWLLLDAAGGTGELLGGTGQHADVSIASEVARHRRTILAGGLGPENVDAAIRAVQPAGVDASSGLESAPGVKDPDLVRRFVVAARAAEAKDS